MIYILITIATSIPVLLILLYINNINNKKIEKEKEVEDLKQEIKILQSYIQYTNIYYNRMYEKKEKEITNSLYRVFPN